MNHKHLLACVALSAIPMASMALPTSFYAPSSSLGKGNWVKVGIEETGIYEITYDQLREMGFSNPASVAVYGRGGRQMAETFTDAFGNPLITSDIPTVPVLHSDNKIFFYGLGIEDIAFVENSTLDMGGSFIKNSRNIYSNYGYYFLTDSTPVVTLSQSSATVGEDSKTLTKGAGFVYHELDLKQNNTNTGQLFWGEKFYPTDTLQTWDVELPDLAAGETGAMECKIYTSKGSNNGYANPETQVWLGYGIGTSIKNGTPAAHFPTENQTNIAEYIPQNPSLASLTFPAGTNKVFVEFEMGHDPGWYICNLDHWVLTYPKNIPTLRNTKGQRISQDLIAFPELTTAGTAIFEISDPTSKSVWDVTDPANPRILPISVSGNKGEVVIERTDKVPVIAIFDRMSTQKRISGLERDWERIVNQNLHSLAAEGCDMAIITLPWLVESALKIADLHEREYGEKVIVTTAQEVYNEFSGGVPDPMAYRSMVKMFYTTSGTQIRNLLLVGPIYADFRGLNVPIDPEKGLIGFQSHELNLETNSMNANDFYGMMTDYFNVNTIEKQTQHVGVGILPVYSVEELDKYVNKLEKFMTDDSFAYRLTSSFHIGGVNDNHLHDNQAVDLAAYYNELLNGAAVNTVLAIDAYGYEQSRNKWNEAFNNGRHMATYFGHGAASYLGQNRLFFTSANVSQFKNTHLPFMCFFGCTISDCDHGIRGLGESMVFDTDHGIIGALLATRSTWSGQNFDFSKLFFSSFYYASPSSPSTGLVRTPLSLGEALRKAKNISLYTNEMAYQLLADPGLIMPVVLQRVSVMAPAYVAPGQTIKFSGSILKPESAAVDTEFNGELIIRVMEPEFSMVATDLISTDSKDPLKVTYADEQLSMSTARVVNGKFEAEVYIPLQLAEHEGRYMTFNFCAYNAKTKIGAAANKTSEVKSSILTTRPTPDVTAPVIDNLAYNHETKTITLTASDNVALDLSRNMLLGGFQAYIDGDHIPEGSASQPKLLGDGPRRYSREFYIGDLPSGQHNAHVIVKDAAGNKTESQITFTISDEAGKYRLAMKESGLADSATLYVDGDTPATATIYIVSPDGSTLRQFSYRSGDNIVWDGTDLSGKRVAPGRYKAYLRETGTHQTKGHSDAIVVPVI